MTTLRVFKEGSCFIGFECAGHSGYSEAGSDIVCAAISTGVQFCINCGEKIDRSDLELTIDQEKALIRCINSNPDTKFSKHIEVLLDLAESIQNDYSNYFNLEIMEV